MADKTPERAFQIPKAQLDAIKEQEKMLPQLKAFIKDLKALGRPTTQEEEELKKLEDQINFVLKWAK